MLGHKMFQVLREGCDVYASFRRFDARLAVTGIFDEARVIDGVDAWDGPTVERAISQIRPEWIVNCIGLIRQPDDARSARANIYINALFPHLLCEYAAQLGARVIHVSTDSVFSGKRGDYSEEDPSDALDLYGKAKHLGEVAYDHALTLRTSIVGRDLFRNVSLIDWFLSQSGKCVQGYTRVIYTGLSTDALSREIRRIVCEHPKLHGLYHISSAKISKFELLALVNRFFNAGVNIRPFDGVSCDRSLRSDRYRRATGFVPPSWEEMVAAMASDPTAYDHFRRAGN
jgi:dTDP-4-dehydrorhamnose reductase